MTTNNDYYTYAYLREDKTPYYIGKGRGKRAYDKRRTIKPPKDKSRIIFLKKNLMEAEAFKHEEYMIFVLGRKDLGTGILRNRTDGGEGPSGAVRSAETKKKLSEAKSGEKHPMFGVPRTEEWKQAHSERMSGKNHPMFGMTGENHPRFGVPHTEETKKKISVANTGKTHTEEAKKKIGEATRKARTGVRMTEETKKKLSEINSGEKHPRFGKPVSAETRERIKRGNLENAHARGKKWWVNKEGKVKFSVECPGEGWRRGRK